MDQLEKISSTPHLLTLVQQQGMVGINCFDLESVNSRTLAHIQSNALEDMQNSNKLLEQH